MSTICGQWLASAAVILFGRYGDVSRHAKTRGISRQQVYRERDALLQQLDQTRQRLDQTQEALQRERQKTSALVKQLAESVVIDRDRQNQFASTAQAEGVSLPLTRRLLHVFLAERTPSVAQLGRWTQAVAKRSAALLTVFDEHSRPQVKQAASDELHNGKRRALLVMVEPKSLCWLGGQLSEHHDGESWQPEFARYPQLQRVVSDQGVGMKKAIHLINQKRHQQKQPPIHRQLDHFHVSQAAHRALQQMKNDAQRALRRAERADRQVLQKRRQGHNQAGRASAASRCWEKAEQVMDEWIASSQAWRQVEQELRLLTPTGALNTRGRAEAAIAALTANLKRPHFNKAIRLLRRAETLAFLDWIHSDLAKLPGDPEVKQAALRVESQRRQPPRLATEVQTARQRIVLLAMSLALCKAEQASQQVCEAVRRLLNDTWRASSSVEGINSVLRMQQARHRRLTQDLVDLKRLYWNCRPFRTGHRRGKTPYQLLGMPPPVSWWAVLQLTPQQLRETLSGNKVVA